MKRTVYIISGPAGVGKSTTSKRLVKKLERSSYISGDAISHLPINGRGKPWLCSDTHNLTWENILGITRNLIEYDFDVVIDYVSFPQEVSWLGNNLKNTNVNIVYVVFMVDRNTIIERDQTRKSSQQMGERSLILLKEFEEAILENTQYAQHILNTQKYTVEQLDEIIDEIIENKNKYIVR